MEPLAKQRIRFCPDGDPSLLVVRLEAAASASGEEVETFAVPLFARQGGLLLAIPDNLLNQNVLATDEDLTEVDAMFGPGDVFSATLHEDSDEGLVSVGLEATVQVFDASDRILQRMREFDPVTDSTAPIRPFHPTAVHCFPCGEVFVARVQEWMRTLAEGGGLFYSAQEDLSTVPKTSNVPGAATRKAAAPKRVTQAVLLEKLDALAGQMQVLVSRQDMLEERQSKEFTVPNASELQAASARALPSVSAGLANAGGPQVGMAAVQKALNVVGPPPRHKEPKTGALNTGSPPSAVLVSESAAAGPGVGGGSSLEAALVQQSTALTSLVAHLAAQTGDSLGDLNLTGSSSQTSGTRGVLRRERLQAELANRTGGFYLSLMQQMHRRLHPGKPVPATLGELQSLSMLTYLERQGGYRNQRNLGHVVDAINAQDWDGVRELMALTVVAVEQSAVDQGDWSLAFLLALVAEPPVQMFQERSLILSNHGRPFAPLCPAQWAATTLSFLKDMETLNSKKAEIVPKTKASQSSTPAGQDPPSPNPKRRQRYPKKLKQGEESSP